jgi:HK97 family phage prohead protease
MGREFLVYCLEPWLRVMEGALRRALFLPEERADHVIRFDRDDLTRADLQTRATTINSLVASRVINPNEGRSWLGARALRGRADEFANPNITAAPARDPDEGNRPASASASWERTDGPLSSRPSSSRTTTARSRALAWPFGTPDRIGDVIEKGAFASAALPLPMLFGHDLNDPVGAGTRPRRPRTGCASRAGSWWGEVTRAREVRALVRSGAVRGVSIGFRTRKAVSRKGGGRTITDLELLEASLVTIPMHPGAKVTSAKSALRALALASAINRARRNSEGSHMLHQHPGAFVPSNAKARRTIPPTSSPRPLPT